jgi:hypothetical protein
MRPIFRQKSICEKSIERRKKMAIGKNFMASEWPVSVLFGKKGKNRQFFLTEQRGFQLIRPDGGY